MEEKAKKISKPKEENEKIGVGIAECEELQKKGYKVFAIYEKDRKLLYDLRK